MTIRTLLLGACLLLISGGALAQVYKWTDEQGDIHYGDRQPEGVSAERVNIHIQDRPSETRAAPAYKPKKAGQENGGNSEKSAQRDQAEHRKRNCEVARTNLRVIENNSRIQVTEDGARRYLTPAEIEAKRTAMEKLVSENCGSGSEAPA